MEYRYDKDDDFREQLDAAGILVHPVTGYWRLEFVNALYEARGEKPVGREEEVEEEVEEADLEDMPCEPEEGIYEEEEVEEAEPEAEEEKPEAKEEKPRRLNTFESINGIPYLKDMADAFGG